MIERGTRVTYQYRQHQMLGGGRIVGAGEVVGWTMVGTDRAYVIRPDAGDTVHVRCAGVKVAI